jgi:hypothetical protein
MRIIKHTIHENYVLIELDTVDFAHPEKSMRDMSIDPAFLDIARKYGLGCEGIRLRYPEQGFDNTMRLYFTTDDRSNSFPVEDAYIIWVNARLVKVHKDCAKAGDEAFALLTGQSLKELWREYCVLNGIPVPKK